MIASTRIPGSTRRAFVVGATVLCLSGTAIVAAPQTPAPGGGNAEAAAIKNPIASSPESIAAGKATFSTVCAACHGAEGKGGIVLSVIEDRGGNQPPDLTDAKWDHGSSEGEIFTT